MAFGLGFDKNKILQAAEKYVIQGKLQAAIGEYSKILKKDPQDLMTLNTIGDLHARTGQNEEAIKCFYELAEKYLEGGYVARAIAVYKRITKLDFAALPALLKLGELYFTQGLTRDSRTHYLQAVELHLRRGEREQAREVFEKIVLLDMENPRLQVRMAELYAETGKPQEAIATYLGAAERFLDRNELEDAEGALQAVLRLDAQNIDATTLLGRLFLEQEKYEKAIATLEAIPNWAEHKGALNALFHAYRKQANLDKAREVAAQLFDLHEDFAGMAQIAEEMVTAGNVDEAFGIYEAAEKRLLAQRAFAGLAEGLQKIVAADPSYTKALELLWEVQQQAGNRGEAQGTAEMLGHAYVEAGELGKAREIYAKLVEQQPEDPELKQLLRQVETRLHGPVAEIAAPPSLTVAQDLTSSVEQPAVSEASLPPREQEIVRNCLTESELYITYHQIPQAIDVLEKGLEKVPGNITLYEQLLPLYERSEQFQKAVACAEALTEGYIGIGDGERAARYGELIFTYQQKAQESEAAVAEAVPSEVESSETAAPAPAGSPTAESQVREIDLSQEWAALSVPGEAAATASSVENTVEEIEFYLQAGLSSDAAAALGRLQEQSPEHPAITGFQERLATLLGVAAPVETPAEGSPGAEQIQETAPGFPLEAPGAPSELEAMIPSPPPAEAIEEKEEEPAFSLQEAAPISLAPERPKAEEEAAVPLPEPAPESVFGEFLPSLEPVSPASSFELSLEESVPGKEPGKTEAPAVLEDRFTALTGELNEMLEPSAAAPVSPVAPSAAGKVSPPQESRKDFLEDVFAEFKEEVEEPTATEGDLETHYNMGVAFKEMALYDEAIGEFQKVHQIAEKKKDYSHLVQCCSLLATCFLEKGLPQLAVQWYQTALNSPGIDPETSLALLYEVGTAHEIAGDRAAALRSFLEVYARNIDYRNVADRIRDLQQNQ
ncbi:MAG: tetratricopeptide repeat protein [Acidobacteria bacterium]|nr:tetratricopeptide repeat protein [Acidobacteriota bacterium]